MAVKFKIKKGDQVKIIAGDDKGKTGKVKAVYPKKRKVVVEKAIKPTEQNPQGGFENKEMPMDISNVALVEG